MVFYVCLLTKKMLVSTQKIERILIKTSLTKRQHMRNHKLILFVKINKVSLDMDIKVTLFLKGETITLTMDIKVTQLIKEDRATLVILNIKVIPILDLSLIHI